MSSVRFVGLDVHKDTVVVAVAEAGDRPAEVLGKWSSEEGAVLANLKRLGRCRRCGSVTRRGRRVWVGPDVDRGGHQLRGVARGWCLRVTGSKVKTDRRDARKLAHFLRSGDLTTVWIPDPQTEAIRDLVRSRDDARLAKRRVEQQLLKFLLRQGRRFTEGQEHWTKTHWAWVRRQTFEHEAQNRVLADLVTAIEQASERVKRLDVDLAECQEGWALANLVRNFAAFRGIKLLTAVGLAAEIGDFSRFTKAPQIMAYVGWSRARTRAVKAAAKERLPRPATGMCEDF